MSVIMTKADPHKAILIAPTFTPEDTRTARAWHIASGTEVSVKGRVARALMVEWHMMGRPTVTLQEAPTVVATLEYRVFDSLGRFNKAARVRRIDVHKHNLRGGMGRPASIEYIEASGLDHSNTRVARIVTANGALHSVSWDHDNDCYAIRWESKADQKEVVLALLDKLAEYRAITEAAGIDTSAIDSE